MKILFVKGMYDFCYYYRGYLPGVYGNHLTMPLKGEVSAEQLTRQAGEADCIVFQRPTDSRMYKLALLLKQKGKRIIFENDDTYSGIPLERLNNEKQIKVAKQMSRNLTDFLRISDGAIASTETLAKEFRKYNRNVVVLKNTIDPDDEFPVRENTTGKFRVGFIGSVTSNDDYLHIKDQIRALDERGDITIVVMGVKHKDGSVNPLDLGDRQFWGSLKNIEWHPYCHVTEYMMTLANLALDLAIIPRLEHYFNECKSNLKFLEMSLLKIPVLAQGFTTLTSPYEQDKDYLTLITNNDTWYDEIIKAKDTYQEAKAKAEKAYEHVLANYNIHTYAGEWTKQIEHLCTSPKSI